MRQLSDECTIIVFCVWGGTFEWCVCACSVVLPFSEVVDHVHVVFYTSLETNEVC